MMSATRVVIVCIDATPASAGQDLWTPVPYPVESIDFFRELVATQDHLYAVVEELDDTSSLFRRPHTGGPWETLPVPGNPFAIGVAGAGDLHLLVSTKEQKIWYSGDSGCTWIDRSQGLSDSAQFHHVLVFDSGWSFVTVWDSGADSGEGVARSSDFGATWELVLWCPGCVTNFFLQLETNGDPQYLWAVNIDGFFYKDMRRTIDWGATWNSVDLPPLYAGRSIDLVLDPFHTENSYMLAAEPFLRFEGYEYAGYTYPPFGSDANMNLSAPAWDPGTIYASGLWSSGLVAITRSGSFGYQDPWETVREGIPQEYPPHPGAHYWKNHMEPHPTEPRMYLAVYEMGLFERDFALGPSSAPEPGQMSGPVRFGPAAPNPTTGSVDLALELDTGGPVRLEILDVSGRRWFGEHLGWRDQGVHVVGPAVSGALGVLPAGVYFVKATSGEATTSRRISIVR